MNFLPTIRCLNSLNLFDYLQIQGVEGEKRVWKSLTNIHGSLTYSESHFIASSGLICGLTRKRMTRNTPFQTQTKVDQNRMRQNFLEQGECVGSSLNHNPDFVIVKKG